MEHGNQGPGLRNRRSQVRILTGALESTSPVAVVTAANRGIGLELCRQLAAVGYTPILGSRDLERGRQAGASLSDEVEPAQLDVADPGPSGGFFRGGRSVAW